MNTQEKILELEDDLSTDQPLEPLYKRLFVLEENLTDKEIFWVLGTLIFLSSLIESVVEYFYY